MGSSPKIVRMWPSPDQMNALLYWDDPRDSGIVCGSVLVCLLAVRYISLISVVGNLALALVTATLSFRIYKSVLAAVNKSSEGHPFKDLLEIDVRLPADKVSKFVDSSVARLNGVLVNVKAAILVEDIIGSIKFALGMYMLTYVGAMVNGLTLLTLAWVVMFALPRLYKDNQKQIDDAILPLKTKLEELQGKLSAALPASLTGKKEE